MRFSVHRHSNKSIQQSKWLPFNRILTGICILLLLSFSLNVLLLSQQSISSNDDVPEMTHILHNKYKDNTDCDIKSQILNIPEINNNNNDNNNNNNNGDSNVCHFNASLKGKIYLYDIPYIMREIPRGQWYSRFTGLENYNDTKSLNFGFGKKMHDNDWSKKDFHLTHMHVLEVIFNERLKTDKYYLTNDPEQAMLFHIPYPFALHYRFWERTESQRIAKHHIQLQEWLNNNKIYQQYFMNESNRRPHILTFGRIAYETVRLEKMGSKFFSIHNGDVTKYWILSIDRNCHGDPPSCWKRISMPHPSNYHPMNVQSLKAHIGKLKEVISEDKKSILVSFCGYIRTPLRNISRNTCSHFNRKSKWRYSKRYDQVCVFEDGEDIKKKVGRNKLKVQHAFSRRCNELYEKSIFCIQDGADSTTRKGLWDGIIAGCIPVFLSGVMSDEFDCYGNHLYPWYVVQQREFYVNQLLSLPTEYIKLLQMNLLRLIPKILYTNGHAGFADAIDLIWHCLLRKTSFENPHFNPKCNINYLVENHDKLYDFDKTLGYDKLYGYLEI